MGIVYLADDTRLSRRVALKAIAPGAGSEASRRARMRQEARAAAGLSHPGIATVYALEEIDDQLYLACEYVPGPTLRALLKGGPLALPQVVDIAAQLARALAAAHAHGVVHRDLKPENIVRSGTGVVKILDFGIARVENLSDARLTMTGTLVGTPAYMAPEQIRRHDVDFRADLFAFGLLVYEMTSGSNPFEAESASATIARILETDPPPLAEPPSTGLQALDRIVAICLRKRAEERYGSTQELVADLERLQADMLERRDHGTHARQAAGPVVVEARRSTAQWWWEFHQVAVSTLYALMIYPAWRARVWLPAPWGMLFFFAVLAAAATSATVRLHLRFTARVYPGELPLQRQRALPWTPLERRRFFDRAAARRARSSETRIRKSPPCSSPCRSPPPSRRSRSNPPRRERRSESLLRPRNQRASDVVRTFRSARHGDLTARLTTTAINQSDDRRLRIAPSVNSSDSRGTSVTNGPISHPNPNGMSRLREIDSHWTTVPSARSSSAQ